MGLGPVGKKGGGCAKMVGGQVIRVSYRMKIHYALINGTIIHLQGPKRIIVHSTKKDKSCKWIIFLGTKVHPLIKLRLY